MSPSIFHPALLTILTLSVSQPILSASVTNHNLCKAVPGSPNWPSAQTWQSLNRTLKGALLAAVPPALVCDESRPSTYSHSACANVGKQWSNSSLHSSDPVSVDWPNWQSDGCLPTNLDTNDAATPCNLEPFPRYVVNVSTAAHVSVAVKFAFKHNVRLSVKGTGHDFLGRSTSPGLSIWTHHLNTLTIHESFTPQSCPKSKCTPTPAITVSAGSQFSSIYPLLSTTNYTVVGGGDPNVGIGGFLTGGGHSPVSAKYGLASDNILEMTLVTPTGEILVSNKWKNPDLFWAMRGGGGATFGVLLTATLRLHPRLPVTSFVLQFNSTATEAERNNNTNFFSLVTSLNAQLPEMSETGLMGYYYLNPVSSAASAGGSSYQLPGTGTNTSGQAKHTPMTLAFLGWSLNQSYGDVRDAFSNITNQISRTPGISSAFYVLPERQLNLLDIVTSTPGSVGVNVRLGSRLLDAKSLLDATGMERMLRVFERAQVGIQGLFTSGPGVRGVGVDASAVNPAWRDAYLHLVIPITFPYHSTPSTQKATAGYLTHTLTAALRAQAPDTGCYLNEADTNEPDWEHAFWGEHYERLLSIKKRIDPTGVFWCGNCVGGNEWKEREGGVLCNVD